MKPVVSFFEFTVINSKLMSFSYYTFFIIFKPPISKKLTGHNGFGLSVRAFVCMSVRDTF